MKLNELGAQRQTEKIAKVMESHLGARIDFDRIRGDQARALLTKVRSQLREHQASPSRHYSERNPAYLKLMMMEQALVHRISELSAQRRALRESEVQQAQVVMAVQDMVDRMQKMLEDISEMQFKDLPALADSIKNDMGMEQSSAFQSAASAALQQLLAAVQEGKNQMEQAQAAVTGQAPAVPGDMGDADLGEVPPEGAEGAEGDLDLSLDGNLPPEDEAEPPLPAAGLGRERR